MRRRVLIFWLSGLAAVVVAGVHVAGRRSQAQLESAFENALAALQRNDPVQVRSAITRLEGHAEYDAQVHMLRGALLAWHGEYKSALFEFSRYSPRGNVRNPTLLLAAKCRYRLGQLQEAEQGLRELLTDEPENVNAHRILAAVYCELGAPSSAAKELEEIIRLAPRDYTPHRLLAMLHIQYDEYPQATRHFRRALELSPLHEARQDILANLGYCLLATHDYQAAIDVLNEAAPTAVNLARRSECYWGLGQRESAELCLEQAQALAPGERTVLFMQARLQIDTGHPDDAVVSLEQLLSQYPYDTPARYQLALAYRLLDDNGRFQTEMARWQELQALSERFAALSAQADHDPSNADLRDELADVCSALGRVELAQTWRRAAQSLREQPLPEFEFKAGASPALPR